MAQDWRTLTRSQLAATQLGHGKSTITLGDAFPSDPEMPRRWTAYAEVMGRARGIGAETFSDRPAALQNEVYAAIADDDTELGQSLDPSKIKVGESRGHRIEEIFLRTMERLVTEPPPELELDSAGRLVCVAWQLYLTMDGNRSELYTRFAEEASRLRGNSRPIGEGLTAAITLKNRQRIFNRWLWMRGLDQPAEFQRSARLGYAAIVSALDQEFAEFRVHAAWLSPTRSHGATIHDYLPEALVRSIEDRASHHRDRRAEALSAGRPYPGITESGNTLLFDQVIPKLLQTVTGAADDPPRSSLLVAPTSSGKTFLARLAMVSVREKLQKKVIVLQPTKALVDENVREWQQLAEQSDRDWRPLAGSRDYPENDDPLRHNRYDIAVLIPEKLIALLGTGMTLDRVGLIVIDELQSINDGGRGQKLQMLGSLLRNIAPRVPILGLSASFSPVATEVLRQWLQIEEADVLTAAERPVPLHVHVIASDHAITARPDGSRIDRPGLPTVLKDFDSNPKLAMKSHTQRHLAMYREGLQLALGELLRRPHNRTLFFVASRPDAEQLAQLASDVIAADRRFTPELGFRKYARLITSTTDVFDGRFEADEAFDDDDKSRMEEALELYPRNDDRVRLLKAIRNGIGYHSRSLDSVSRVIVGELFSAGVIRLLFCTDTLKVGLNFPADTVINGTLLVPGEGGRRTVLDRDAVIQRLGRAGRFGLSEEGNGYIMIPDVQQRESLGRAKFRAEELNHFARNATGTRDHRHRVALAAIGDPNEVFIHYAESMSNGIPLTNVNLNAEPFAELTLSLLERRGAPFETAQLQEVVGSAIATSMASIAGGRVPSRQAVVDMLVDNQLINTIEPGRDLWQVSGLGSSIAGSGIPLGDASHILRLATTAEEGAGAFTLLLEGVRTSYVRNTTQWVSTARLAEDRDALEAVKESILKLAELVAGVRDWQRGVDGGIEIKEWLPDTSFGDAIGSGEAADKIRSLIEGGPDAVSSGDLTPLLRASVLLLWTQGCPIDLLRDYVEGITLVKIRGRENSVKFHYSDVQAMGDVLAYQFSAVAEVLGLRPTGSVAFRRIHALVNELGHGVPSELVPLSRVLTASAHRERIVHLRKFAQTGSYETLSELVSLMRHPSEVKPGARAVFQQIGLPTNARLELLERVRHDEQIHAARLRLLPTKIADKRLPRIDNDLAEINEMLHGDSAERVAEIVAELLTVCGVTVTGSEETAIGAELHLKAENLEMRLLVTTSQVTSAVARELDGDFDLVVAPDALTPRAITWLTNANSRLSVIAPSILVQAVYHEVARMIGTEGELEAERLTEQDLETILSDPLAFLKDDGEGDETVIVGDQPPGDPANGDRLLRYLRGLPPTMSRIDLENLEAARDLVGPPF